MPLFCLGRHERLASWGHLSKRPYSWNRGGRSPDWGERQLNGPLFRPPLLGGLRGACLCRTTISRLNDHLNDASGGIAQGKDKPRMTI